MYKKIMSLHFSVLILKVEELALEFLAGQDLGLIPQLATVHREDPTVVLSLEVEVQEVVLGHLDHQVVPLEVPLVAAVLNPVEVTEDVANSLAVPGSVIL